MRQAGDWESCKASEVGKLAGGSHLLAGVPATTGAWLAQPDMSFLGVCAIIFLGSLVSGAVPFFLNLGERHVSLLSAFGAGMLVSTALAVILPEGIEAFHNAEDEFGEGPPHALIGLSIVLGFVVMLVADHLQGNSGHLHHAGHDSDDDPELGTPLESASSLKTQQESGSRAFLGLIVHSLADGVAVGTTGMSDREELKLVVAFAMVLHKLPATFGLVSFLIACRWPLPRVRRALVVFAASAPLMALITYWLLVLLPGLSSPVAVALWLSASGGTFLYASCMHVLPHVGATGHRLTNNQVLGVIAGCAVPVGIQFASKHHR